MSHSLLTVAAARAAVLSAVEPLATERVDVTEALDRVLAEDLPATGDVPPFACSAMDGYAVIAGDAGRTLRIVGESRAGAPSPGAVGEGEAMRVSTGAVVPAGATAVVRQEDVEILDGSIRLAGAVRTGADIRGPGEDLRAGQQVLAAGTRLGAAELGAAVAAGAGLVLASPPPRVAVLCTGDELRAAGEPLGPGQIHNSNAAMLVALATRCGADAGPAVRLGDDRARTVAELGAALERADVVVVSGGVSVGPHDHVKPALATLGVAERFWGVNLQPGRPTWFGVRNRSLVFGLPGNPVSAFVTFALFVRPAIAALQGLATDAAPTAEAELGTAVARHRARELAVSVRIERRGGRAIAWPNGPQGSHLISSLLGADALAFIPQGEDEQAAGSVVALVDLPQ
ncbi:MAG TPA: gephyrin-like molybdotransferase Glp [Solirubrobacteraceae bacterium]|nr:gephyrin-like molybdotransferase Glp [Solirubrobacteraceae bacterium]